MCQKSAVSVHLISSESTADCRLPVVQAVCEVGECETNDRYSTSNHTSSSRGGANERVINSFIIIIPN